MVSPPDEFQPQGLSKSSSHLLYELLQVSKLPVPGPRSSAHTAGRPAPRAALWGGGRFADHAVTRRGARGHRGGHGSLLLCSTAVKRVTQVCVRTAWAVLPAWLS